MGPETETWPGNWQHMERGMESPRRVPQPLLRAVARVHGCNVASPVPLRPTPTQEGQVHKRTSFSCLVFCWIPSAYTCCLAVLGAQYIFE